MAETKKRNPSKKLILNEIKDIPIEERKKRISESKAEHSAALVPGMISFEKMEELVANDDRLYACFHFVNFIHGKKPSISGHTFKDPQIFVTFTYGIFHNHKNRKHVERLNKSC